MHDELRIRRATETDDPILAAMTYDSWSPETCSGPVPDPKTFFDQTEALTVDNTLVAFLPEAVAGFVSIAAYPYGHRQWAIRGLTVGALFRRRGIGLSLARAATTAAHTAGGLQLRADVPAKADAIQRLLIRAGFTARPPQATSSPPAPHDHGAAANTVTMVKAPLARPGS